ncbi:MAG: glycosyltransferase [Bacillota bacterium]|nr:glycosyltransferase [Bacillota bacterium]
MSGMRVAMFTDSYTPYVSGVVRSILLLKRELERMGHEVTVFAPDYPGVSPEADQAERVIRLPSLPAPTQPDFHVPIPWAPGITRRLRQLEVEVVHSHSPFVAGGVAAAAARRLGLPLVFTYHTRYDLYTHYAPIDVPLTRRVVAEWATFYANSADQVIAPSPSLARWLEGQGVTSPIRVIPSGIDLEVLRAGDPEWLRGRLGLEPAARIVLYAGRLGAEKNLDLLFRAFARVAEARPDVHLALAGDGTERRRLEAWAREAPLAGRVHFLGTLAPEELRHAYHGATCFAFPSTSETQGLVLAEAMGAGLPPVAVAAPASCDTVRDGVDGLLVPDSEEAMAAALLRLVDDPRLRALLGSEARRRAESFSVRRTTALVVATYEAALASALRL